MDSAVFTVDLETANTISQPSLPVSFSSDLIEPFCATATKSDGTVVVVVAGGSPENGSSGVDESYIFDVAQARSCAFDEFYVAFPAQKFKDPPHT